MMLASRQKRYITFVAVNSLQLAQTAFAFLRFFPFLSTLWAINKYSVSKTSCWDLSLDISL